MLPIICSRRPDISPVAIWIGVPDGTASSDRGVSVVYGGGADADEVDSAIVSSRRRCC